MKKCADKEHPRVDPTSVMKERLRRVAPEFSQILPLKLNASHVAMLQAGKPRPTGSPPACPDAWAKAGKRKRGQQATANHWVVSHLCHHKRCVNSEHLIWEPDWYNRARDNCPGVVRCDNCNTISRASCRHVPACGQPHRQGLMDWRTLVEDEGLEAVVSDDGDADKENAAPNKIRGRKRGIERKEEKEEEEEDYL